MRSMVGTIKGKQLADFKSRPEIALPQLLKEYNTGFAMIKADLDNGIVPSELQPYLDSWQASCM